MRPATLLIAKRSATPSAMRQDQSPRLTTQARQCACGRLFYVRTPKSRRQYCGQRCNQQAWWRRQVRQHRGEQGG